MKSLEVTRNRRQAIFIPSALMMLIGAFGIFVGLLGHGERRMMFALIGGWALIGTCGVAITWWRVTECFDRAVQEAADFERELCDRKMRPTHVDGV